MEAQSRVGLGDGVKFSCKCSFLEIYNETISDLLAPESNNLQVPYSLEALRECKDIPNTVYDDARSGVSAQLPPLCFSPTPSSKHPPYWYMAGHGARNLLSLLGRDCIVLSYMKNECYIGHGNVWIGTNSTASILTHRKYNYVSGVLIPGVVFKLGTKDFKYSGCPPGSNRTNTLRMIKGLALYPHLFQRTYQTPVVLGRIVTFVWV